MDPDIDALSLPKPDKSPVPTQDGDDTHEISIDDAFRIAIEHFENDRLPKTRSICEKILVKFPEHARAMHLLGLVIYQDGDNEGAAQLIRRASVLRPDLPEFQNSLGMVMMVLGRYEEGLDAYRRTRRLINPDNSQKDMPKLLSNIGNALQLLGRFDEALEHHNQALKLRPDDIIANWNRAHIHLIKGHFKEGWPAFERRFELPKARKRFYPHVFDVPKWDGSDFHGKRLFIHDEQGLGDIIQFARFLPLVKERGGHVIFEVRGALKDIFSDLPGVDELVERVPNTKTSMEFDLYCPIMSLAAALGTTMQTIPATIPYVRTEPDKAAYWKQRFIDDGFDNKQLKIGLVWSGNLNNIPLRHRSFELRQLAPYLNLPGIQVIGLQKGEENAAQMDALPEDLKFPNYGNEFEDFTDTAGALANVDLLLTIDTSVAHMAGAMGVPTWMMLAFPPDWRWFLEREDSPWYPDMRIFRQQEPTIWWPLFEQVGFALREAVQQHQR